jgi:hypothetical protein
MLMGVYRFREVTEGAQIAGVIRAAAVISD